jgi:hypothetical protein
VVVFYLCAPFQQHFQSVDVRGVRAGHHTHEVFTVVLAVAQEGVAVFLYFEYLEFVLDFLLRVALAH